jgi:hypothetical protein
MSVGATKSAGVGIPSFSTTTAPAAPAAGTPIDQLKTAVDALAQNPIIRALLGNSGFDGLGAQGKGQALGHAKQAEKAAGAGEPQTPEQGLQKLLEGLQKFVELLGQLLGKQAGGEQPAEAAGGAQGAGGAEGAQGAQGGEGAAPAQNAPEAAPTAAPAPAQGAEEAEEAKSPMQQLLEALTKLIEKLVEFSKAMEASKQQGAPEGVAVGEPNGAPQGIAVGEPNGAAPAPAVV